MEDDTKYKELELLALQEGGYQDIEIHGHLVYSGWRECEKRFSIIEPHLPQSPYVAMDIGSHYGYFSAKMAGENDNLVLSIEPDQKRRDIQLRMLELNGLESVILCSKLLSAVDLFWASRSCMHVDVILALSMLHYVPPQDQLLFVWCLSQLSPLVVIEFAVSDETDVANADIVACMEPDKIMDHCFDEYTCIGESASPSSGFVKRPIFLGRNTKGITRRNCLSHMKAHKNGKHVLEYVHDTWVLNGEKLGKTLLNLSDVSCFEPVSCLNRYFRDAAKRYYGIIRQRNGEVTDIHPRNVLIDAKRSYAIDYKENLGQVIYGMKWDDYVENTKALTPGQIESQLKKYWQT
jgi:hypothetical protein